MPNRLLRSTYWSSFAGKPDEPEYYNTVSYELEKRDGGTLLTVIQDNVESQESADHSSGNWGMVLKTMKDLLER